MNTKLLDFYKALNIENQKTDLTIVPFEFDTVMNQNGNRKVKGHDGVLYDLHSEASFYSVKGANDKAYKVFAFIGKPDAPAPESGYPAVVLAHGGAGIAYFEWVEHWVSRGYVAIAPDLGGHYAKNGLERNIPNEMGSPEGEVMRMGSFFQTNDVENSWMYFGVTALGTAINALQEYVKIDLEKLALVGISWGGVLSLHTAGVEPRFKAVSIIYSSAYITYTDWAMEANNVKSLTEDQLTVYRKYLDPSSSIQYITQPILFTAGTVDPFTMLNRKATAEAIITDKKYAFRPNFTHGHWEGWTPVESYEFTDAVFGLRTPLPHISLEVIDGQAMAEISCVNGLDKVCICYTVDPLSRMINQSFEECEMAYIEGKYVCKLPKGITACFARYITDGGMSFSTDLKIL